MTGRIPEDDDEFHTLMLEIDRVLSKRGQRIHQRPFHAISELAKKSGLPLAYASSLPSPSPSVADRVNDWYQSQFGDRLKISTAIGEMVIPIEGDLWIMSLPRVFGTFPVNDKLLTECIHELPPKRWNSLSDSERRFVFESFVTGYEAFSLMRAAETCPLIKSALADITAAVVHLTDVRPDYGLSKWSSLQVAEKLLKSAIESSDGEYQWTHNLTVLKEQANAAGLKGEWSGLLKYIQCTPGIRYGDEPCSLDEALTAHLASLTLALQLALAGAEFSSLK